jgi:ABC-type sulfate/molybdate transport systems ATPase subunit/ABC-type sulfate transport system permease component
LLRRNPLSWLGALLVLYLLVPLVAFGVRASGSDQRGFNSPGLWEAAKTSALTATVSTVVIAILGIPLAHWLATTRGPLSAVINVVCQLPLALPPVMSGIVLIYLVGPYTRIGRLFGGRLTDSDAGVVLAQIFVAAPFLIIAARSAFAAIDPSLDDLAATLGHRPLARFLRVSVPVALPGIRAGLLLTWLRALGEYGATVLLAYHPYSLPVFTYVQFSSTGIPTTQAPTIVAIGLAVLALLVSRVAWPSRLRPAPSWPPPHPPAAAEPALIAFDLDTNLGSFRLRLAHTASSHRIAILGPSGSGKSLTLKCLAGLLGPAAGTVTLGPDTLTGLSTPERNIGYVPQNQGLFPGRTVREQVMFARRADAGLAAWWLATLQLEGLLDRLPNQLSGGQRQRVSLAQAVSHNPRCLLLDEPFSALDAPVREELRRQLRRLQHETALSTVLVTHDPEEAAMLADEILVIADGQLLQAGSRAEVYHRPASAQVARLLGISNLTGAIVTAPDEIVSAGVRIAADTTGLAMATEVLWCIREEQITIAPDGVYPATIVDVVDLGSVCSVTLSLAGGPELRLRTTASVDLAIGTSCQVDLKPAAISVWPASGSGNATSNK